MGLVSAFSAIRVLLSSIDIQSVFLLCVALVYETLLSSRIVLVHLHLSLFLWDVNSAGAWGSSSPAKLFVAVRLGRSQSSFQLLQQLFPSLGPSANLRTPGQAAAATPLPLLLQERGCSAWWAGNQTGISSPLSLAGLRPSAGAAAKSPKVPAGPAAPGLVAGVVSWGAQQGHQGGVCHPCALTDPCGLLHPGAALLPQQKALRLNPHMKKSKM